jgi:signal transduction histidine kinase
MTVDTAHLLGSSASSAINDGANSHAHSVQFYTQDDYLLDELGRFVGSFLGAGDAAIVIATPSHHTGLVQRLEQHGFDVDLAISQGRYVALDAADTLSLFMIDGQIDPERCMEVLDAIILAARAAVPGDHRRVAAFGEMVALLWAEGNSEAALELEEIWNKLATLHPLQLRCAYPLALFPGSADGSTVKQICSAHSYVIPAEDYTAIRTEEERLTAIAILQQKAQALETEIEGHRQARGELERAIFARDAFLSVAAHELKTPITGLRGYAQLLLRDLRAERDIAPGRLEAALRSIDLQTGKLAHLISRLLDSSQIEAGKLRIEPEITDIASIVRAVLAQQDSADHSFIYEGPDHIEAQVDPLRFEQVITNLINNAIKFSPQGGIITARLEQHPGEGTRLSVIDHGVGIPPDHREAVFDRFYQAHSDYDRHLAGMGLGLHIAREIVHLHGGSIRIEQPDHRGSCFVVTLPPSADDS